MAGKSLPPVSAKVIADAEQFIAEFRRAERAAAGSSGRIGSEVDKMAKQLNKKFSLGDIGKDVLKGFGLGSGFAVAQQGADMLVGHYERAAQAAKDMEESTARQLSNTKELIRLHQTDQQELDALNKEFEKEAKILEELKKPVFRTETTRRKVFGDWVETTRQVPVENTAEHTAKINAQTEAVGKLDIARQRLGQTVAKADQETSVRLAVNGDALNKFKTDYEGAAEAEARGVAVLNEWNAEMDKAAQGYREMADPALKFRLQQEEINDLLGRGKLKAEEAAEALAAVGRAMREDESRRVDSALNNFFDPLDEKQKELDATSKKTAKAAHDLGWAFSSAFEDAILSGDKFSDVLKGLGQDILRIAIRTAITQPIGAAIGGMLSSGLGAAFTGIFGGGKAVGGPVNAGTTYMVGEEGPEMFVPKTAGNIIPNDKLSGSGGNTYVIDARGADVGVVDRIAGALQALAGPGVVERRALSAFSGARRRGYAT